MKIKKILFGPSTYFRYVVDVPECDEYPNKPILHRGHGLPAQHSVYGISHYYNGKLHRWNGPSFDGNWSIHAYTMVTGNQYFAFLEENNMDINNLTDSDKILIAMRFAK